MDAGVQTVAFAAGIMLAILALAGCCLLARHLWDAACLRRAIARGEAEPGTWLEEAPPADDSEEQRHLARWQALLDGPGLAFAWTGSAAAARGRDAHPVRRRVLIAALLTASLPAGYLLWSADRLPRVADDPAEVLELVSIETWPDAVGMFEDKLRVRCEYRNLGERRVDAFSVFLQIHDEQGREVLRDVIEVSSPVAPGAVGSWTQAYWGTCAQVRSPEALIALAQRDIRGCRVQWRPLSVLFDNGEARTAEVGLPGDSFGEYEP